MMRDALLAIGVIFASFTQLRFFDAPLGFGELFLVAWLGLTLGRSMSSLNAPFPPALLRLAVFWILLAGSLCVGTMTAFVVGERNSTADFVHDTTAYTLMAALSLLAVAQAGAAPRMRRVAWLVVLFGSGCLAAQLAQAFGVFTISGVDVWFWDRLIGWSTNANQLGLLCLILALLSCHLAETATGPGTGLAALACVILPVWAGYLTRSDAFLLALVFGLLGFAGLKFWRMIDAHQRLGPVPAAAAIMAVVALPALLAASSPLAYVLAVEKIAERAEEARGEGGLERDVGYRTELWGQAIDRGVESGMLGLGPGPHLKRPADLREPQLDALPNFEAHNTVVDLFLQGGLLAVASLLWLGATTLLATLKEKLNVFPILLISVGGFALTHFVIRHPIVWFVIAFGLVAKSSRRSDSGPAGMLDTRMATTRVGPVVEGRV